MTPRVIFPNKVLPYLLVAPQLAITLVFFYWPASQALYQSMLREDPFGLRSQFVGLENFRQVLSEPNYLNSIEVTAIFSIAAHAPRVTLYWISRSAGIATWRQCSSCRAGVSAGWCGFRWSATTTPGSRPGPGEGRRPRTPRARPRTSTDRSA